MNRNNNTIKQHLAVINERSKDSASVALADPDLICPYSTCFAVSLLLQGLMVCCAL